MSNQQISRLYDTVRRNDVRSNNVTEADIKAAIEDMKEVYLPRPHSLYSTDKPIADYNTVAHRCAYLYKYAPLHSAIVRDELKTILNQNQYIFFKFYDKLATSKLKICSLGGGPGSDIVGIAAALSEINVFQCSAKVVDLKADWEDTLRSVVQELRSDDHGAVGKCFQAENFDWDYLTADLLEDEIKEDVTEAVGEADLVTMVKFVSAASCQSTYPMLKKIFRMLKPGSMVLFIDNASGGFSELMTKVSIECNMTHVYGPIDHRFYTYDDFKTKSLCGHMSCYRTTITIHMMEKLDRNEGSSQVLDQCKNIARAEAGWSTIEEPIPISAQRFYIHKNGIVVQRFATNDSDEEIEAEEDLEYQVNCCSSCVIS